MKHQTKHHNGIVNYTMYRCIGASQLIQPSTPMPPSNKDEQAILQVLAEMVAEKLGVSIEILLKSAVMLDEGISKTGLDWKTAARKIGLSHHELYRWYHDTFQRKLHGPVGDEDMSIIRAEISKAMTHGRPLNQDLQFEIKEKLSKQYHRSSFTVAFNNAKRLLNKKEELKEGIDGEQLIDSLAQIL